PEHRGRANSDKAIRHGQQRQSLLRRLLQGYAVDGGSPRRSVDGPAHLRLHGGQHRQGGRRGGHPGGGRGGLLAAVAAGVGGARLRRKAYSA
ncbi:unnamed protein product, partial [Ectocarpus fasciculatus]